MGFPESPTEPDEVVYPCKGCGEVCSYAMEIQCDAWYPEADRLLPNRS